MPKIIYLADKFHVDSLREMGVKGIEYFENLEKTAAEIKERWKPFDTIENDYNSYFNYFQNPENYCVARIRLQLKEKSRSVSSIVLSFIEKAVLMETAKTLGLPIVESNILEK